MITLPLTTTGFGIVPLTAEVMTLSNLAGVWVSIFLTLAIFSFLYEDNPIYKLAEHIFLGISIAIGATEIYFGVFKPNLIDKLAEGRLLSIIPLMLLVMLLLKVTKKLDYMAKVPIAFIVAAFAGVKLTGEANANLMTQVAQTMPDLPAVYEEHGIWSWDADGAGVFSSIFLVLGLCACLLHFYFSARQTKSMAVVSKVGIIVLMLSFGASFGYTVMGRISLAIGRAQELLGLDKPPIEMTIGAGGDPINRMSLVRMMSLTTLIIIIVFLAVWQKKRNHQED